MPHPLVSLCPIVALAASVTLVGCSPDHSSMKAQVRSQVVSTQPVEANDRVAIRRFLGFWEVDREATLAANSDFTKESLAELDTSLRQHPFELEISQTHYTSRSWAQTNRDAYTIVDVITPDLIVIALTSADGVERAPNRQVKLRLRDGILYLGADSFTCVMNRVLPKNP